MITLNSLRISFFVVFSTLFVTVNAQTIEEFSKEPPRSFLFGQKIGYSFSYLSGEADTYISGDNVSDDILSKSLYGIFANIPISKKISIQPELDLLIIGNSNTILPILSCPILLKYYPSGGFNFQFGGSLNYILVDFYVDYYEDPQGWRAYHRYESGLYGGLGFDSPKFQIYIRYYHGITNINPLTNKWAGTEDAPIFLDYTEKNRSFQIGLEFSLYKRKEKKQLFGKYKKPK